MPNSPCYRWLIILILVMAGCTAPVKVPIIKTPSPTEFKSTTPASIPPGVIPSTPTTIRYGPETIPIGPYTPPSVESVTFPPNSGGGIDRETLMSKHGITDAVLKAYKDAAIQEAVTSGFQADAVEKNYVDQNELWNMYLRDTTTGNLLWSYRKSDNAMAYQPLMWIIDANGVPQPNPDYELRPIAGSTDSRIVYTPGNYLVEIAKPIVLSDGTVLYAQWRSVLTDELADIPGAAALLPTETPIPEVTATPDIAARAAVTPESFRNFNYDIGFIPVTHEQALELSNEIVYGVEPQLLSDDSVNPAVVFSADGHQVWIHGEIGVSLFPRFAISEPMEHGIGHFVLWEIIVKDKVSGHNKRECIKISYDPKYLNDGIESLLPIKNLVIIAELTSVDFHLVTEEYRALPPQINPVIYDVLGGSNPVRQNLQKGIIDDETGSVPIWSRGYS